MPLDGVTQQPSSDNLTDIDYDVDSRDRIVRAVPRLEWMSDGS